jgi:hypothetical protein
MPDPMMPGSFDAWWRAPGSASLLALVRIVIGVYSWVLLLALAPSFVRLTELDSPRFDPVGIVSLLDSPLPQAFVLGLLGFALASGLGFTLGWRYRAMAPAFALSLLWVLSYRNSWGHMSHSEHLLVMHVSILCVCPAADACSLDLRAGRVQKGEERRYGWPLRLMMLTVVLSYMLAGWAKIDHGGWGWVRGDAVYHQVAHDTLRKIRIGATVSPLSSFLLQHPWVFGAAAFGTLLVELGACSHGRLARQIREFRR